MPASAPHEPAPPKVTFRSVLRSIVTLDDTPHSIALGTAIGMFVGLTPTMGFQMALVLLIAFLVSPFFRFNKLAGCAAVYVTNPLTGPPIYFFQYWLGTLFLGGWMPYSRFTVLMELQSWSDWLDTFRSIVFEIGKPLLLGTTIVSIVGGILTYPAMIWLLNRVRKPPVANAPTQPELVKN